MEYTRSIGEHYETFTGEPKEILELVNTLAGRATDDPVEMSKKVAEQIAEKIKSEVNHTPVVVDPVQVFAGTRLLGHKTVDFARCSCGTEGCRMYEESL